MDTKLKCVIVLASLFSSLMLPLLEARPMPSPLQGKDGKISRDVNGFFRILKGSGPSPGVGHRVKNLQNVGVMKDAGPTPGVGFRLKNFQSFRGMKNSGLSPGEGHILKSLQVFGAIKHSGPSPGEGHKYITKNNS